MLRKLLKKWVRDEEAATAVEFSLLFIPYLMLTVAIIEVSMMYFAASLLEGATNSAARLVKTGQVQEAQGQSPQEMFAEAVCDYAGILLRCNDIVIEVQPMANFSDFETMQPQYDEDGNMTSAGFDPGDSNDKILIRTSYRYEMLTPWIGTLLVGPSNRKTFISTVVLQIEPYEFEDA